MKKLWNLILKYREAVTYLFFGGLTTVINIAVYYICAAVGMSTAIANAIAWILSVLFAYITNRIWVFRSHSSGKALMKEFGSFVACRVATGVLDEIIMIVGVDVLGIWGLGVKVFANILVIILNYVFSKLLIFTGSAR